MILCRQYSGLPTQAGHAATLTTADYDMPVTWLRHSVGDHHFGRLSFKSRSLRAYAMRVSASSRSV
jgi:hypothetical protein